MSTQQYTKATAKIPGAKLPIIIVPGIMGSRLTDAATNELVWNPMGGGPGEPDIFAAKTARIEDVANPLVPDETHPFATIAERIRVDPINHFYNTIAGFYGDLAESLHYDLKRELAKKHVTPAVYCSGYDWRLNNDRAAQRLSTVVDEAQADCDGAPVILVAHSMGGLVARHYCKVLGGESKVRALFLLGSPTLGAVSAYVLMRRGLPKTDLVRAVLTISQERSRALMRSMQSAYQLLPNTVYCSEVRKNWAKFDSKETGIRDHAGDPANMKNPGLHITDNSNDILFYRDIYTGLRDDPATRSRVEQHLTESWVFHNGVTVAKKAYMHPNTFAYFCGDRDTDGNVEIEFEKIEPMNGEHVVTSELTVSTVGGDSTVPADSGNPGPVSTPLKERRAFSDVEHKKLSSDRSVINALRARIVELV